jgi:hypothetical protein
LQGSKDVVVRRILQNAVAYPEIPQQDIQVLLWAILARTRIGDMPRKTQVTAARLLTPAQLLDLNGGALGMVPGHAWREATQSLPPSLLRTFEAEARLRQLLSTIDASYHEIERLAVLNGNPAPDPASRQIPAGRWSYHPAGHFIRFFPSGYSRSEVQIYVPEPFSWFAILVGGSRRSPIRRVRASRWTIPLMLSPPEAIRTCRATRSGRSISTRPMFRTGRSHRRQRLDARGPASRRRSGVSEPDPRRLERSIQDGAPGR